MLTSNDKQLGNLKLILWSIVIVGLGLIIILAVARLIFASDSEPDADSNLEVIVRPADLEPAIKIEQSNLVLLAKATNGEVTDWEYLGPLSFANCTPTVFDTLEPQIRSGNLVVLEAIDYGLHYCFRALGEAEIYGYRSYFVDFLAPQIQITQDRLLDNDVVLAVATSQVVDDWQYVAYMGQQICSQASFEAGAGQPLADLTLIVVEPALTYCFRARQTGGVWGYADHRPVATQPQFIWQQIANQLIVQVVDVDGLGEFVIKRDAVSQSCTAEDFVGQTQITTGNQIAFIEADATQLYCFRLQHQRVYYYSSYSV